MGKQKYGRVYVLGDLHGCYLGLREIMYAVNFDYDNDKLIFIGDLADGWGEFDKCLDILLKIKHFVPIIGNHDVFLRKYVNYGIIPPRWMKQGGKSTMEVLNRSTEVIPKLKEYFSIAKYYHHEGDKLFLHGGMNHKKPVTKQKRFNFTKNRTMYKIAQQYATQNLKFDLFVNRTTQAKEIFVGHTPTKNHKPDFRANLINVDTGAGSIGKLTIMDIYKKTYCQSKFVSKYYDLD